MEGGYNFVASFKLLQMRGSQYTVVLKTFIKKALSRAYQYKINLCLCLFKIIIILVLCEVKYEVLCSCMLLTFV